MSSLRVALHQLLNFLYQLSLPFGWNGYAGSKVKKTPNKCKFHCDLTSHGVNFKSKAVNVKAATRKRNSNPKHEHKSNTWIKSQMQKTQCESHKLQCENKNKNTKATHEENATKKKNAKTTMWTHKLQGQCKDKIRAWRVLVYSGARRVGGGLHVPLKAAYTQRPFGTVRWRVGKNDHVSFWKTSTKYFFSSEYVGVRRNILQCIQSSYAMMLRHQNNLLWKDLFYLRSSDEKWNVSSDQGRH